MSPLETTTWRLGFASDVSAWWLVVLLPVLAWLVWRVYRLQLGRQGGLAQGVLSTLRVAFVLVLVVLIFRPVVRLTHTSVFPPRILHVVDDSQSMSVRDTRISGPAALYMHRQLFGAEHADLDACHRLRAIALDCARRIRRFAGFTRTVDRLQDAFWEESARVKAHVTDGFDQFEERASSLASTGTDPTAAAMPEILSAFDRLSEDMGVLFEGERDPGQEAYVAFADRLAAIAARLADLQAEADARRLADGNETLVQQVSTIRSMKRAALVETVLPRFEPAAIDREVSAHHRWVRLSDGAEAPIEAFSSESYAAEVPHTDILGRLRSLVRHDSPFPLAGVTLLSDGRDLSGIPGSDVHQLLSERQVPVFCAAVGAREEPYDLAVADVSAPPFAVVGEPARVRFSLKTLVPEPATVRARIVRRGAEVAGTAIRVGESTRQTEELVFTPEATGLHRYAIQVDALDSEAVGAANNRSEFVVNVRERQLRVIYLDSQPNWDVRFALDTLQRLPYARLDKLILSMLPGARLQRGTEPGSWPRDENAFGECDLVILGTLRPGVLTQGETPSDWAHLEEYVRAGGTLCFFDVDTAMAVPEERELAAILEPVTPLGDPNELLSDPGTETAHAAGADGDASEKALQSLQNLLLLPDGYYHPITHGLSVQLPVTTQPLLKHEADDIQTLLLTRDLEPLVRTMKLGRGNVVLLQAARLWAVLDPTLSDAHAQMFTALVQGAVEGRHPEAAPDELHLSVHRRRLREGVPFQVVVRPFRENLVVEAVRADAPIASVPVEAAHGQAFGTADFPSLPPGDVFFRVQGNPAVATPSVRVLDTGRELVELARDDPFLAELAQFTGGRKENAVDLQHLIDSIKAVPRRESSDETWDPGASPWVLAALMALFVAELITRKAFGMV
mgnify:CR=1 FL=1